MDNSWQFVLKYMHINSGYLLSNWRLPYVKNTPFLLQNKRRNLPPLSRRCNAVLPSSAKTALQRALQLQTENSTRNDIGFNNSAL